MAAHRYWRVVWLGAHGGENQVFASIAEVEMRLTEGGADQCAGGTALGKSSYDATFLPAKAFDNDNGTKALSENVAASRARNWWIGYDFGAGNNKDIVEILLRIGSDAANDPNQAPTGIRIDYSDDGLNWRTVRVHTGLAAWTASEARTFSAVTDLTSSYDDQVQSEGGLVSFWKGADAASPILDHSGYGRSLTTFGAVSLQQAAFADAALCFALNGTDQALQRALDYIYKQASFAIEALIKPDPAWAGAGYIAAFMPEGAWGSARGVILGWNGATKKFSLTTGNGGGSYHTLAGANAYANEYLHVVGWYDRAVGHRIYVNKVLDAFDGTTHNIAWTDSGAGGPFPSQAYVGAGRNNASGTDPNVVFLKALGLKKIAIYASPLNTAPLGLPSIEAHYDALVASIPSVGGSRILTDITNITDITSIM